MKNETEIKSGLEGVLVAKTALSEVDGQKGELVIAGLTVEKASSELSFEAICALLWSAGLATTVTEDEVRKLLGKERSWAEKTIRALGTRLREFDDGMDAMRTGLSFTRIEGLSPLEACARVTAMAAIATAYWRFETVAAVDSKAGHADDVLRLLTGKGDPVLARGLGSYLVTVSDHGLNASTFTARVIASTASDLVSAVVGGIGALKGPLHGGAPGPVLDMLDAIGEPERAEAWLADELEAGRRIMGMGHRIYRVRDPRAHALELAIERLPASVRSRRLELARAVEKSALGVLKKRYPDRPLEANVEFFTAVLLDTIGLDRKLFSPVFAISRIAGWCAHYFEQQRTGRLIRPDSVYVGPRP